MLHLLFCCLSSDRPVELALQPSASSAKENDMIWSVGIQGAWALVTT